MAKTIDNDDNPKHEGDVLGISDADPGVTLPFKGSRRGRTPQGIDVGAPATGIGDVRQGTGATGVDLGGSEGIDIHPEAPDVEEKPDSPAD
jgi:hypothetical protein